MKNEEFGNICMNKLLKKTLKIILPILLGGFILYWVYRDFDFSKAEEVLLHQTNWWWMLLSLFFGVMSHVLRGWRWKQTLEPLMLIPKQGLRRCHFRILCHQSGTAPCGRGFTLWSNLPNMIMFPCKVLGDGGDRAVGRYALHSADYGDYFLVQMPFFFRF